MVRPHLAHGQLELYLETEHPKSAQVLHRKRVALAPGGRVSRPGTEASSLYFVPLMSCRTIRRLYLPVSPFFGGLLNAEVAEWQTR
jgi:hypothetical protein